MAKYSKDTVLKVVNKRTAALQEKIAKLEEDKKRLEEDLLSSNLDGKPEPAVKDEDKEIDLYKELFPEEDK